MKFPEFALHWAEEIGARSDSLERLSGGINNNVFTCTSNDKNWVIKGYPHLNTHGTDRMQAEVEFLEYSSRVAKGFTPTLIKVDTLRRCTVMEHVSGSTYSEGVSPDREEIQAALSFVNRLNRNPALARNMIRQDAAEGFLSLRQHMENVTARVNSMGVEHLPSSFKKQSGEIIDKLRSNSEKVAFSLEKKIESGKIEDTISHDEQCISPSDFGFHNAIRTHSGVVFIDFEFAGWDDPAKFCVDFTLQQRNPVNLNPINVASILFPDKLESMESRINSMQDILLLKWLCIILSIFNPKKLLHMIDHDFNGSSSCDLIVSRQLTRYLRYSQIHLGT